MTKIVRSGGQSHAHLWSMEWILDSAIAFVSVAGSTSLVAEPDFVFGLHNPVCVGCRLYKNRGSI